MKTINVLIVDDRDIIRDSLKMTLSGVEGIKVKDDAADGREAMKLIEKNDYDVVLMDINMPTMDGIEATKQIIKINPNIKILANSFYVTPLYIKGMIKAGSYGFITKGDKRAAYIEAIRTVANGAVYLSDEINNETYDQVLSYLKTPSKIILSA